MTEHRIIQGDVLDGLRTLPDGIIQTVVTSPPYYALRNYGVDGQIGSEETLTEFIQKITAVFREVRRVLREDGTLWLNFGDSYAGGGKGPTGKNGIGDQTARQGFHDPGTAIPDGLKAKDMMGVPWRVAFALQADGWYLRSDIIWNKPNPMPESVTDRPTKSHEYIFLLTKSPRYFYDAEAIREGVSGGTHARGDYKGDLPKTTEPGQGIKQNSSWVKACWSQPPGTGKKRKGYPAELPDQKGINGHSGNTGADGQPLCDGTTRNARTVWTITTQARPEAHFATFPDEIPRRCISAGTSEYGCCPKCGAPYQRIVEASGGMIGASWHPHENDEVTGQVGFKSVGYRREFKGWKPGCDCIIEGPPEAAQPVPCVVLDPFLGSGTTMRIARDLGRSSIGCELNPAYIKIARKLLQADSQLDTGAVSYRFEKVPA